MAIQYVRPGDQGIRDQTRDARFIYNRLQHAPMIIWLAEASGVDQRRLDRAASLATKRRNSPSLAAAVRRLLPWSLVVRHLRDLEHEKSGRSDDMYADCCIYTVRHSDAIRKFSKSRGPHVIDTKRKRWTAAKQLIANARKQGKLVPLLFAPAEDTADVVAWAELPSAETGRINKCTFRNLRYLSLPLRKTKLRKGDGTKVSRDFIREYMICRTPVAIKASNQIARHTDDREGVAPLATLTTHTLRLPEELPADQGFDEGAEIQVLVNRYERDTAARDRCIKQYGSNCIVCGLSLGDRYGAEVNGLIHVHHLTPLASVGMRSSVDPVRDLRPVCPNCHAVIHSRTPPRTIEQVRAMIEKQRGATAM